MAGGTTSVLRATQTVLVRGLMPEDCLMIQNDGGHYIQVWKRILSIDGPILNISFIISSADGSATISGCPGVDSRHPSLSHHVL